MTANTNTLVMPRSTPLTTVRNYLAITKPAIILLLLITTVPAMVVAQGGWPSTWLVIATLIGGAASAGGANAVNCWYDRDIDAVMKRTRSRPLVTGEIEPARGLAFGLALGAGAFVFLYATTTALAAWLTLGAYLFYVVVYTMWLKRRTPQNIVIGGAAGAFPPIIGWAAVTGDVSLAAIVMFLIVFMWTPPHFWALALRLKDDYSDAGVPMLPVVAGPERTRREIVVYSAALIATSLALVFVSSLGWVYASITALASVRFMWLALRLWRTPGETSPMSLYTYSLLYLAVVFVAMAVDVAIPG